MATVRSIVYTIRLVTDKGTVVKAGTTIDKLEDDLWALYDADLIPFPPAEDDDDGEDDEDEAGIDLDEEADALADTKDLDLPPEPEE